MAYYTKEIYEAKKEWAVKKHERIKRKCDTLTDEQHDVLAWLATIRHEMHSNAKAFWEYECLEHKQYWDYIDDGVGKGMIRESLTNIGLPDLCWNVDIMIVPTSIDLEWGLESEELGYEDMYYACMNAAEQINNDIESYLRVIDTTYGTEYCPSGVARSRW